MFGEGLKNSLFYRLGIPAHLSKTGKVANFATLQWQPNRKAILCRIYLNNEELFALHKKGIELGSNLTGKLLSEFRLFERDWPVIVEEFCSHLDVAHRKMLAQQ